MTRIRNAAVAVTAAALLGGGLLASGTATAAGHPADPGDVWYTFQNFSTDRNLDAYGGTHARSYSPDGTMDQEFHLVTGKHPGYQVASKRHANMCFTAKGVNKEITLETCNTNLQSQYWNYDIKDSGSSFQSRKFPQGCIQDNGTANAVILRACNGGDLQRYLPLVV